MTTILVVNNDPRFANMLRSTLIYAGFNVLSAGSGAAALHEIQAHRPKVVVLNPPLAGVDGSDALRCLRASQDRTMVLVLAARNAVENRVEGLESSADDYLAKPFGPSELLERIHGLLRRPAVVLSD